MPAVTRKTPVYQMIQSAIVRCIADGTLRPGDLVPSERELARTHRVSNMTARHALSALAVDGIVERRIGHGTYVSAGAIGKLEKDMVRFSASSHILQELRRLREENEQLRCRLANLELSSDAGLFES